ncbi:hypothetical protein B1756_09590 [Natrarchaeobaculum aegyptiacum]|uniref:DUF4129 domain-containing protein n=1 Tax=Natrarchaeobaculum aegyptiacum TaxID=745377 RepID=A0A2Z2HUW8_9EURY|nr:hypothetical protein B1756_09590 [Natrarchaeobaculum aegyptiacum]
MASLLVVLLVAGSVATVGGTSAAVDTGADPATTSGATAPLLTNEVSVQADSGDANQSEPHVNPDEYDEDGDLSDVRTWQVQQLANHIQNATDDLETGDDVEDHFDESYREHYDEYAGLVREDGGFDQSDTDFATGIDLPDAFEDVADDLVTFAVALERYDDVADDYERAVERGDEDSARDIALELDVYAAEVEETGSRLDEQFDAIEAHTAADLGDAPEAVASHRDRVREAHADVAAEQFVETPIDATADADAITPADTVTVTGSIDVDDRWPDDREAVTIEVNGDPHTVPLVRNPDREGTGIDHDGDFSLEYQPDPFAPTTDELTVTYVPTPGIGHRAAETTVPVAVEPVDPSVSVFGPEHAAYGDTVLVEAELEVDGDPLDDVPIALSLGGEELEVLETTDGTVAQLVTIPAAVPAGEPDLVATVDLEGSAIGTAEDWTPVRVDELGTQLSVTATSAEADDEIVVDGTLRTDGGQPVGGQPIQFAVDDEPAGETQTASDGSFEQSVSAPADGENATVTASFDGGNGNLESTQERTTVQTTTGSWLEDLPAVAFVLAGSIVLGGVLVGLWRLTRYYRTSRGGTAGRPLASSGPSPGTQGISFDPSEGTFSVERGDGVDESMFDDRLPVTVGPSHAEELLKQASTQLSNGQTNDAVQSAYVAARTELQSYFPEGKALTHWEFQERYSGPHADALAEITEQYERAAFGLERISREEASNVVVSARHLVEGMRGGDADAASESGADGVILEE